MRKTDTTINIALPTMAALDATALTPAQLRAAAITVAANAVDADDARRLLDMLGLEAS